MTIAAALTAFLPVAVTLVLVPGVNNLVVLRETVAHGRPGGYAAIAGTSIGILSWSAAVALGLGALAKEHPGVLTWLHMVGAALLITNGTWSALRLVRSMSPTAADDARSKEHSVPSQRSDHAPDTARSVLSAVRGGRAVPSQRSPAGSSIGSGASFRTAAMTSLANPRCPVTAASVLPQFVAPGTAAASTTLALGALWTVVAGLWNVVGVNVAHRGRGLLSRPGAQRAIEGVSSAALVAVGISVVAATT